MANFNATLQEAAVTGPKVNGNVENGSVRVFASQYVVVSGEEPQVGDTITWGTIPSGVQLLGSISNLNCSIGNAGATLTLGDADDDNELLAATDIGTAASVTPLPLMEAGGAIYITDGTKLLTSTVGVDELLAGQTLRLRVFFVQN